MNYYHSNLSLLRKKEPELAKRLEHATPKMIVTKEIALDPEIDLTDNDIIVVIGFGSGEIVKEVLKRTGKGNFILVIDHDLQAFKNALHQKDLSQILKEDRVSLAISEDPSFATNIRIERYFGGIRGEWKILIVGDKELFSLFPEYYGAIKENLQTIVNLAATFFKTSKDLCFQFRRNLLRNIVALVRYPGVDRLFSKFRNLPAILVNPGPSLNKNIDELRIAKNRALIISVDTALNALLKNRVNPDFVVSVDPGERNYNRHFKNLSIPKEVSLIADILVYPDVISNFRNHIFISSNSDPLAQSFTRKANFKGYTVKGGGSTSHIAFSLAKLFRCNPIIFIGLDLSFGDKVYADGIPKEKEKEEMKRFEEEETILIDGNYGDKVRTTYKFLSHLNWFETAIRLSPKEFLFINATQGGARISGTKVMSLKDAINSYCKHEFPIKEVVDAAINMPNDLDVDSLLQEIKKTKEEWCEVLDISNKSKMIEDIGELDELRKDILQKERFSNLAIGTLAGLLHKMDEDLSKIDNNEEDKILKITKIYKDFFQEINKTCKATIPEIEEVEKRLSSLIV